MSNPPGEIRVERFGWTYAPGDKVMHIEKTTIRMSLAVWMWTDHERLRVGRKLTGTGLRPGLRCPASRSRALAERTVQAPAPWVVRPAEQDVQRRQSQGIASVRRARHG